MDKAMTGQKVAKKNIYRRSGNNAPRKFVSRAEQLLESESRRKNSNNFVQIKKGFRVAPVWIQALTAILMVILTFRLSEITDAANQILDRQLTLGTRAWIIPVRAEYAAPEDVKPGDLLQIKLHLRNSGNEPARNVIHYGKFDTVTVPKNSHGRVWFEKKWRENRNCVRLDALRQPDQPIIVVYPSRNGETQEMILNTFTGTPLPESFFKPVNLKERSHETVFVEGCFSYRTAGIEGWSKYCFYAFPEPNKHPNEWKFARCPRGNDAE